MLDSSVIVSGLRSSRGASNRLLGLIADRVLVPLATSALLLEYEDVLKRPEQRAASGLTIEQIDAFLAAFIASASPVTRYFSWRPQLSDPGDEMVLEAAVNGQADGLVTHNIVDFAPAASQFGLVLLRPGELLERLRQ